ncbi:MAG: 6-phosphogluconolactonase [Deltaproteobacteria bacterium]|nr:6-phosphogluconolactonase [Deltaproteobacteria bacterium]
MKPNVEVIEPKLFTGVVADEIVATLRDTVSERQRCSLVLAGGSTPGSIYRLLARPPRVGEIEWEKIDIYWGDERWVPLDHTNSNFRMTKETLLSHIPQPHPRVHPVNTSLATAEEGAADYARTIKDLEGQDPCFDLVLLGIGEDGHTASIFPNASIISDCPDICAAVEHPEGGFRITLSPKCLFNARKIMFIVKGESKADIISRVIDGSEAVETIPARLYLQSARPVSFFLDSGAALRLSKQ